MTSVLRSPRRICVLVVVLAVAVVGTACGSDEKTPKTSPAFCTAADRFDKELERQAGKGRLDIDRQITRVEELVATAPAPIRADAEMFLDALRRVRTDPSIKDDRGVKRAIDAVNRYAAQGCNVYQRDSSL